MRALDIKTLKPIEVPNGYYECSVCGIFHPKSAYCKPGEETMCRTNCLECYNLPFDEMKSKSTAMFKLKTSPAYRDAYNTMQYEINLEGRSIPVAEMIEALQQLPEGSRLVVTQEGYYAEGSLGDIYTPAFINTVGDVAFYTIGHSSQPC